MVEPVRDAAESTTAVKEEPIFDGGELDVSVVKDTRKTLHSPPEVKEETVASDVISPDAVFDDAGDQNGGVGGGVSPALPASNLVRHHHQGHVSLTSQIIAVLDSNPGPPTLSSLAIGQVDNVVGSCCSRVPLVVPSNQSANPLYPVPSTSVASSGVTTSPTVKLHPNVSTGTVRTLNYRY